jgi:hypothetical protein
MSAHCRRGREWETTHHSSRVRAACGGLHKRHAVHVCRAHCRHVRHDFCGAVSAGDSGDGGRLRCVPPISVRATSAVTSNSPMVTLDGLRAPLKASRRVRASIDGLRRVWPQKPLPLVRSDGRNAYARGCKVG